jgi:hypothetical protein
MPEIAGTGCVENLSTWVPSGQWLSFGVKEIPDPVLHAARLPEVHQVHIDAAALDAVIANDVLRGQSQRVIDRMVYVPAESTLDWAVAVSRADALGLPVLVRDATFDVLDPRVDQLVGSSGAVLVKPAPGRAAKSNLASPVTENAPLWLPAEPHAAMNEVELQQLSEDIVSPLGATDDPNLCMVLLHRLRDKLFPGGVLPERALDDIQAGTWRGGVEFSAASRWGRVATVESITKALTPLAPGSTAFILVDRAFGKGHAVAMYKLEGGGLRWVDLSGVGGSKVIPVAGPGERLSGGVHPTEGGVALRVLIANAAGRRVSLPDTVQSASGAQALIDPPVNREYAGSALTATFTNNVTFDGIDRGSVKSGEILVRDSTRGFAIVTDRTDVSVGEPAVKFPVVNLRFVSGTLSNAEQEFGYHEPEAVTKALQFIEGMLTSLPANGPAPASSLADIFSPEDGYEITNLGRRAYVRPRLNREGYGTRSAFTAGVSTEGLYAFLKEVQRATQRAEAARHLEDGLSLGKELTARFFVWREFGPEAMAMMPADVSDILEHLGKDRKWQTLAGYTALFYINTAARARREQIPPQENMAAVPTIDIIHIRDRLSHKTQSYLEFDRQFISESLQRRLGSALSEVASIPEGDIAKQINDSTVIDYISRALEASHGGRAGQAPGDTSDVDNGMLPPVFLKVLSDIDGGHQKSVNDMLRTHEKLTKIARDELNEQISRTPAHAGPSNEESIDADASAGTPDFAGSLDSEGRGAAFAAALGNFVRRRPLLFPLIGRAATSEAALPTEGNPFRLDFPEGQHHLGPVELQQVSDLARAIVRFIDINGPATIHIEGGGVGRNPIKDALTPFELKLIFPIKESYERAERSGGGRATNIANALMSEVNRELAEQGLSQNNIELRRHNRGNDKRSIARGAPQLRTGADHRAGFVWCTPIENTSTIMAQARRRWLVAEAPAGNLELAERALANLSQLPDGQTNSIPSFIRLLGSTAWAGTDFSEASVEDLDLLQARAVTPVKLADARMLLALRTLPDTSRTLPDTSKSLFFLTPNGRKVEISQDERISLLLSPQRYLAQVDLTRAGMARALITNLPFTMSGRPAEPTVSAGIPVQLSVPGTVNSTQNPLAQTPYAVLDSWLRIWLHHNHVPFTSDQLHAFLEDDYNKQLINIIGLSIPQEVIPGMAARFVATQQPVGSSAIVGHPVVSELNQFVEEDALTDDVVLPPGSRRENEPAGHLYWVGHEPKSALKNFVTKATEESNVLVIFLGGKLGEAASAEHLGDLRRLSQLFSLNRQQFVVMTETRVDEPLTDLSEKFGFSIVSRVAGRGLDNVWEILGDDTNTEQPMVRPDALLLTRAAARAKRTTDKTSPAVAKLLLAPDRAAKLKVLNASRDQLTSEQARNELAAIVKRVDDDPWFRGFTPLLGDLGASGKAEFVLDYQEMSDATARKHLLIGQGRDIPVGQRVDLIADSGHSADGATEVMRAVDIMFERGSAEAVEHLVRRSERLEVAERQDWVNAIQELAEKDTGNTAQFLTLAKAVLDC